MPYYYLHKLSILTNENEIQKLENPKANLKAIQVPKLSPNPLNFTFKTEIQTTSLK